MPEASSCGSFSAGAWKFLRLQGGDRLCGCGGGPQRVELFQLCFLRARGQCGLSGHLAKAACQLPTLHVVSDPPRRRRSDGSCSRALICMRDGDVELGELFAGAGDTAVAVGLTSGGQHRRLGWGRLAVVTQGWCPHLVRWAEGQLQPTCRCSGGLCSVCTMVGVIDRGPPASHQLAS